MPPFSFSEIFLKVVQVRTATERSTMCPFQMRKPQTAQNFGELVIRQADKGYHYNAHSPIPRFWG